MIKNFLIWLAAHFAADGWKLHIPQGTPLRQQKRTAMAVLGGDEKYLFYRPDVCEDSCHRQAVANDVSNH
jgi:hypothetical protein